MTKAEQIRQLYDGVRSTREIAEIVGCRLEYVRVVARQRVPGGHDASKDYARRWKKLAKQYGDRDAAREAGMAAKRRALEHGGSEKQANQLYGSYYHNEMRKTALRHFCKRKKISGGRLEAKPAAQQ